MDIAYLASAVTLPNSPTRRSDAFEHDQSMAALGPAMAQQGFRLEAVSWDDRDVDWTDFDAAIIGTTWDYWDRHEAFLDQLRAIESATNLFNPSALVRWNSHKTYLRDLANRGARLIPTLWHAHVDDAVVRNAFAEFGCDDLVVKRQVGAGASGQHRLRKEQPVPPMTHPMMIQPFLPAIREEGEYSFVMIDGALSHALLKRPAANDYRIQSEYGGTEIPVSPSANDLIAAQRIIDSLESPPLYARVDMVRGNDGELWLMELELIEPFLYPLQGAELGQRLAKALKKRLA